MEYTNIQWIVKSPFYLKFKKHFCPKCNILLQAIKVSRIVQPGTPGADDFDLGITGGPYFIGKVKVQWKELECPQCGQRFSVERMKEIEGYPR